MPGSSHVLIVDDIGRELDLANVAVQLRILFLRRLVGVAAHSGVANSCKEGSNCEKAFLVSVF